MTSPEPTAEQVDAAVRSVLAGPGPGPAIGSNGRAGNEGRESFVFAGGLLSQNRVETLPKGVREVRVGSRTVVTPLALDLLKRRGIAVRLAGQKEIEVASGRGLGEWGFAIEDESGLAQALRRSLLADDGGWADVGPHVLAAAKWVALGSERGAVVVATESSVAAWAANRIPGLRAAAVVDADSVARAVRHLGANLLVIEPAGKSLSWLRQMCAIYRKAGAPRAPDWLRGDGS